MQCLARAMDARGFKVTTAGSVFEGLAQVKLSAREYAVVDMRLEDGGGLDVISALKQQRPDARAIILTGYGNIATAVSAVKLGAHDYLTKPVYVDDGWHPSSDRIGLPGFLALNPLRFQERRASH
jgi:two-component system response regulator RegA